MEISQMPPRPLGNFPNTQVFEGYLGIFPNAWVSGNFPKCLGIWEISQIPTSIWGLYFFKFLEISQIPRHLGNFPNTHVFEGYLGIFSNAWVPGKFPKCLGIWEISQIPTGIWGLYIFKILEISQILGYLRNFTDT